MTRKALAVAGAAAVATLAIGGVALAAGTDDPGRRPAAAAVTDSRTGSPTGSPTDGAAGSPTDGSTDFPTDGAGGAGVDRDLATAVAVARVGGGYVSRVEQEWEHGRPQWKVRVVKDGVRYDVRIDAASGEITRFEAGNSGGNDDRSGSGSRGNDDRGRDDDSGNDDRSGSGGGNSGRH